jgi:hypothetical protein
MDTNTVYRGYDVKISVEGINTWHHIYYQGRYICAVRSEQDAYNKIDEFKKDKLNHG